MEDAKKGTILKQEKIDEFFINRMERRYGLNQFQNALGRKLKQTGEFVEMYPMTEYAFLHLGIEYYLVYTYLNGLMIKDTEGGYKTLKTRFLIREMEMKFSYRFKEEELKNAYEYLLRNNYIYEIYDGVKFPDGLKDSDCQIWITSPEAIHSFEAMMQRKESKNAGRKKEDK